jgi:hypothetical protein
LFWDYGNGRVYYFGDFQVNMQSSGRDFTGDVLVNLIQKAYYTIFARETGALCTFSAKAPFAQFTGNFTIRNEDGLVVVEASNQTFREGLNESSED